MKYPSWSFISLHTSFLMQHILNPSNIGYTSGYKKTNDCSYKHYNIFIGEINYLILCVAALTNPWSVIMSVHLLYHMYFNHRKKAALTDDVRVKRSNLQCTPPIRGGEKKFRKSKLCLVCVTH